MSKGKERLYVLEVPPGFDVCVNDGQISFAPKAATEATEAAVDSVEETPASDIGASDTDSGVLERMKNGEPFPSQAELPDDWASSEVLCYRLARERRLKSRARDQYKELLDRIDAHSDYYRKKILNACVTDVDSQAALRTMLRALEHFDKGLTTEESDTVGESVSGSIEHEEKSRRGAYFRTGLQTVLKR